MQAAQFNRAKQNAGSGIRLSNGLSGPQAGAQVVEHLEGERRVPPQPEQEPAPAQDEQPGLTHCPRGGFPGKGFKQRHLAEEVSPVEGGEHDLPVGRPFADPDPPRLDDVHVVADVAFPDDLLAVRDDEFRFTGGAATSLLGASARRFHPLRVHRLAPYGRRPKRGKETVASHRGAASGVADAAVQVKAVIGPFRAPPGDQRRRPRPHLAEKGTRSCYRAKINVAGDGVGWNETSSKPASASQAR